MTTTKTLARKLNNALSRGKLLELKPGKVAKVKVNLLADEVYDGLEFPQNFGYVSYPPKDSEILAAFLGGNRDHGSVLNAFKRDLIPDDLEEGDMSLYGLTGARVMIDKLGNILLSNDEVIVTLGNDGSINILSTGDVLIDAPNINFTGDINITGNLVVSGTINGTTIEPPA